MILVFDTETTGLPIDRNEPYTNTNNWPRLVELAAQLYNPDGTITEGMTQIIKPDGFLVPDEVARIHGINNDVAHNMGLPIADVIRKFEKMVAKAELIVCHHYQFDFPVVAAELIRLGRSAEALTGTPFYCTKENSADICQIPNTSRFPGQYKWPSLDELHLFLFGEPITGRNQYHSAHVDAAATARCYFEMKRREAGPDDHTKAIIL